MEPKLEKMINYGNEFQRLDQIISDMKMQCSGVRYTVIKQWWSDRKSINCNCGDKMIKQLSHELLNGEKTGKINEGMVKCHGNDCVLGTLQQRVNKIGPLAIQLLDGDRKTTLIRLCTLSDNMNVPIDLGQKKNYGLHAIYAGLVKTIVLQMQQELPTIVYKQILRIIGVGIDSLKCEGFNKNNKSITKMRIILSLWLHTPQDASFIAYLYNLVGNLFSIAVFKNGWQSFGIESILYDQFRGSHLVQKNFKLECKCWICSTSIAWNKGLEEIKQYAWIGIIEDEIKHNDISMYELRGQAGNCAICKTRFAKGKHEVTSNQPQMLAKLNENDEIIVVKTTDLCTQCWDGSYQCISHQWTIPQSHKIIVNVIGGSTRWVDGYVLIGMKVMTGWVWVDQLCLVDTEDEKQYINWYFSSAISTVLIHGKHEEINIDYEVQSRLWCVLETLVSKEVKSLEWGSAQIDTVNWPWITMDLNQLQRRLGGLVCGKPSDVQILFETFNFAGLESTGSCIMLPGQRRSTNGWCWAPVDVWQQTILPTVQGYPLRFGYEFFIQVCHNCTIHVNAVHFKDYTMKLQISANGYWHVTQVNYCGSVQCNAKLEKIRLAGCELTVERISIYEILMQAEQSNYLADGNVDV